MTESEFARLMGVSRQAVGKARKQGRLRRAVRRGPDGSVDIDPAVGRSEWERGRARLPPAAYAPPAGVNAEEVTGQVLVALLSELAKQELEVMLRYVPPFVAGAVEGLREAARPVTQEELAAALLLEDEDGGAQVYVELAEIASVGGTEAGERASQAGRDFVGGRLERLRQGADDGQA